MKCTYRDVPGLELFMITQLRIYGFMSYGSPMSHKLYTSLGYKVER